MLVDNIDSRANGILGDLAIIPLQDSESDILDSELVGKLLSLCCLLYPDCTTKQRFWRIPENMTAKELGYFQNCAARLGIISYLSDFLGMSGCLDVPELCVNEVLIVLWCDLWEHDGIRFDEYYLA